MDYLLDCRQLAHLFEIIDVLNLRGLSVVKWVGFQCQRCTPNSAAIVVFGHARPESCCCQCASNCYSDWRRIKYSQPVPANTVSTWDFAVVSSVWYS